MMGRGVPWQKGKLFALDKQPHLLIDIRIRAKGKYFFVITSNVHCHVSVHPQKYNSNIACMTLKLSNKNMLLRNWGMKARIFYTCFYKPI